MGTLEAQSTMISSEEVSVDVVVGEEEGEVVDEGLDLVLRDKVMGRGNYSSNRERVCNNNSSTNISLSLSTSRHHRHQSTWEVTSTTNQELARDKLQLKLRETLLEGW